ncbi:hypothetical protein GFJ94_11720 [Flavobacterium sp. LMO8]|uniref:hypothetical protein n=1 Tax=Flavobacterium sp. LMO8 TaxID=2654244 RepID=UPI001291114A|nr:hypothetical protein [Flavobacterium sp. LMO8]MQP25731.1 hypothetical protein [Flavobacterium sp. LMO8]
MNKLMLFTLLILFISCSDNDDNSIQDNQIQIRVSNNSQYNYENVIIHTTGGEIVYNNIASNQVSNYNTFSIIDSDSFVEFTINGNNFSNTFYNDETTNLSNGLYTLRITANGTATEVDHIALELLTD